MILTFFYKIINVPLHKIIFSVQQRKLYCVHSNEPVKVETITYYPEKKKVKNKI